VPSIIVRKHNNFELVKEQPTLTKKDNDDTIAAQFLLCNQFICRTGTDRVHEQGNNQLKRELATPFRKKLKLNNSHIECLESLYSLVKDFIMKTHTSTFMPVNWFSLKKLIFAYQPLGERQINPINSPL